MRYSLVSSVAGLLLFFASSAAAQLATPEIQTAKFDPEGRLLVSAENVGVEGCYFSVYGGLKRNDIDTLIISDLVSSAQEVKNFKKLRTRRKYYCARRTLWTKVEIVCLGDLIGSVTSDPIAVAVPSGNRR